VIAVSANLQSILFGAGVRALAEADFVELHFPGGIQRITNHGANVTLGDARVFTSAVMAPFAQTQGVGEAGDVEIAIGVTGQTVSGLGWMQAARAGLFNGVKVVVLRGYSQTGSFSSYPVADLVPMFTGAVATATPQADGSIVVTARDPLATANVPVSRRRVQAQCPYTLGDADCGVVVANFRHTRTVAAGSTASVIKLSATSTFALAGSLLVIASGDLTGQARVIRAVSGVDVTLDVPLAAVPATGVSVTVTRVCDKRVTTCTSVFANQARNGGFPYAPLER
jgi:uncharacterized phage protein (TIGR02218 family)